VAASKARLFFCHVPAALLGAHEGNAICSSRPQQIISDATKDTTGLVLHPMGAWSSCSTAALGCRASERVSLQRVIATLSPTPPLICMGQ